MDKFIIKKIKSDALLRARLRRVIYPYLFISSKIWSFVRTDKKAAVLVLTSIVISISMVIVLIISQLTVKELVLARKLEYSTQAFYAAQAGIEDVLNRLESDPNLTIDPPGVTETLDGTQYTISIYEDPPDSGIIKIKSEGQAHSTLRTLLIEVNPPSDSEPFLERVQFWGEIAPE